MADDAEKERDELPPGCRRQSSSCAAYGANHGESTEQTRDVTDLLNEEFHLNAAWRKAGSTTRRRGL